VIIEKEALAHVASMADKKLEYQTTWKFILISFKSICASISHKPKVWFYSVWCALASLA
jgi:hypothetical protein